MAVLHIYAIFVIYRWAMFISFGLIRLPRLAFIAIIMIWVRKQDALVQAKWQKWEN